MHRLTAMMLAAAATLACGCGDKTKSPSKTTGSGGADGGAAAQSPIDAAPEVITRLFSCEHVGWEGEGAERQAKLAVTNTGSRPVRRIQTWIYYYKGADQIDRYPHALAQTFEPGVKQELALGAKGDRLKPEIDGVGCEITEAVFAAGAGAGAKPGAKLGVGAGDDTWNNDNLNYNRIMIPRPRAGETHEQLLARTGVKVEATWAKNADGPARFSLKNVSGRALDAHTAWIYYYDTAGKQLGRAVSNLQLPIAAGATVDQELGYKREQIPEGTAVIEATVSKVVFTDGAKETWINRNLARFERPMDAEPAAAEPVDDPADDEPKPE